MHSYKIRYKVCLNHLDRQEKGLIHNCTIEGIIYILTYVCSVNMFYVFTYLGPLYYNLYVYVPHLDIKKNFSLTHHGLSHDLNWWCDIIYNVISFSVLKKPKGHVYFNINEI